MAESIERVKNRTVRGTNKFATAGVVINGHPFVRAGPLTCHKVAVAEVDEQAAVAIGWISEVLRAVQFLAGITDDLACMGGRRWGWIRRLRSR